MSIAVSSALIGFVQIVLALVILYICLVVVKFYRDATTPPMPTRPQTKPRPAPQPYRAILPEPSEAVQLAIQPLASPPMRQQS